MPTLTATLTTLSTPAHTFRASKITPADVRIETNEVIPATTLPTADGGTGIATLLEFAFPNTVGKLVGLCAGGDKLMKFHFAGAAQTAGPLVNGQTYVIHSYQTGDDFTNVGAGGNATGTVFTASGTTPTTWTNGSVVHEVLDTIETGGETDFVWPSYEGQQTPELMNAGDVTALWVARSGASVSGDDTLADFPDAQPCKLSIFYNAN